ncbi:MAG: hypothetical protein NC218_06625 [Acetobacter sp.]|nr:hypothetical protein [Acetobacter sp.]
MSLTEHGTTYDFMSTNERTAFHKKGYYRPLCYFLLFSTLYGIGLVFLAITALTRNPVRWELLLVTMLCCIAIAMWWKNIIKCYNKVVFTLQWEKLNQHITLPPTSSVNIICSIILPFLHIIALIPITFVVIMYQPELKLLAFGSAIICIICLILNFIALFSIEQK